MGGGFESFRSYAARCVYPLDEEEEAGSNEANEGGGSQVKCNNFWGDFEKKGRHVLGG